MAKLTTAARKNISSKNFALPGKRAYPIEDKSHARNALARASGKSVEGKVRAAVHRKYPEMGKGVKTEKAGGTRMDTYGD